jgi:hypothetical protein
MKYVKVLTLNQPPPTPTLAYQLLGQIQLTPAPSSGVPSFPTEESHCRLQG